jgi:molybdopterin molybdotransferase
MAQLSDDCFAFGGRLVPIDEALADLDRRLVAVTEVETVPLAAALGRVAAADLVAGRAVPPVANSAVDGYAVYFDDLMAGADTRMAVAGRVAAGHPLGRPARRGEAIRIFTGAPLPTGEDGGPDTVMMQEDCRQEGDIVIVPPGIRRGANARAAGEDVAVGDRVIRAGQRLGPARIGLAASIGHAALAVRRRLGVALFSTGDEVAEPGTDAAEGRIYDSNRFVLAALLSGLGCAVRDLGILPDRPDTIRAALSEAAESADLIVTSGGVSAGAEDHVKAALEAAGGRLHAWRLAIKPGRPIALGQIGRTPLLGLPGNPVAVMVTFLMVARPVILRLAGAEIPPLRRYPVRAGFDYKKKRDRREYVRVVLEGGGTETPLARRHGADGAGILSSVAGADGLVELGESVTRVAVGETVAYLPLAGLV